MLRWREWHDPERATRMSMPWVYSILAFVLVNLVCINAVIIIVCIRKQPTPSQPAAMDVYKPSQQAAFGSQGLASASPIEVQPSEAVAFAMPLSRPEFVGAAAPTVAVDSTAPTVSRPAGSDEALGTRSVV
mmetsp:Transcript_20069/g.48447  ORF Transcript_20069/g.48447 Transcript_20069/m.48447 type:complete len:131 (+) Transcript_20069:2192-2584(+)